MDLKNFLQFFVDNTAKYYSNADSICMSEDDKCYTIECIAVLPITRFYGVLLSLGFVCGIEVDGLHNLLRVWK